MKKSCEIPQFDGYLSAHREILKTRIETRQWQNFLAREAALQQWMKDIKTPPSVPAQIGANEYLIKQNAKRVKNLMDEGVTDEEKLLDALGNWETALSGNGKFPIVFLGLVTTLNCSFQPRCLYCNQIWLPRTLTLDDWKAIIAEAADPIPPYIYLTGGEPLLLGSEVWGDNGIVAFSNDLGAAVNINTNAALITPLIALQLVKIGVTRLHISIDSTDSQIQDDLFQGHGRSDAVWNGIHNLQIAREVLGVDHPEIHINCVLTERNLSRFPDLLRHLLNIRKVPESASKGALENDLVLNDFSFHLIPVGGSENAFLRLTADEWKRFYTETWAKAEGVWKNHQVAFGVPKVKQKPLVSHVPFANPYFRVNHGMDLDEYCKLAAQGSYWQGALTDRCYVAPTQAFILPDGSQHWCGAHAIRRPKPVANVQGASLRDNIRSNIKRLAEYPNHFCTSCAGATCVINQAAVRNLKKQINEWQQSRE